MLIVSSLCTERAAFFTVGTDTTIAVLLVSESIALDSACYVLASSLIRRICDSEAKSEQASSSSASSVSPITKATLAAIDLGVSDMSSLTFSRSS